MDRRHVLGRVGISRLTVASSDSPLGPSGSGRKDRGGKNPVSFNERSRPEERWKLPLEAKVLDAARRRRGDTLRQMAAPVGAFFRSGAAVDGAVRREWTGIFPLFAATTSIALLSVIILNAIGGHLNVAAYGAVFAASLLSSIAGFAFSAICGAMLFPLMNEPIRVVEIMMVCSVAIQLLSVTALRNSIDWRHLCRFVVAGLAGLPLGIYLLFKISVALYLDIIGVFLIAYGIYMVVRRARPLRIESAAGDWLAGFLGGVTGGFAAFPGAFVTIWCGLKGWDKNRQRGVYQPFILIMQVVALTAISLVRVSQGRSSGIDLSAAVYLAPALLGTWTGIGIFRRLSDPHFSLWVNLLLIVAGLGLIA